jgi:hypothetical protein
MSGLRADEALRGDRSAMDAPFSRIGVLESRTFAANLKILFFLFLLTLPLANPWVRGDGVGYYAYCRSLLIEHSLHFEKDYLAANESFVSSRIDAQGHLLPNEFTRTGYVENHFSIGPAILWAPVMLPVHGAVLLADRFGAHVAADGYSRPYLLAMAATTASYGFLSLCLAFRIARKYFQEQWIFLATVGIWLASSLPVYMYFNPSWSHAFSAFSVALFLWYWDRTRLKRTTGQWAVLGLMAGLMGNVYYPNAILLNFPALELIVLAFGKAHDTESLVVRMRQLSLRCGLFLLVYLASLSPTFISRQIIYGNLFETGYPAIWTWNWTSPMLLKVLFSPDHGMFSWTPILILAVAGLPFLVKRDALLGAGCVLTFLAFYYFIASYPDWDGLSSFGNRFFVSLTPIFILGLTASIGALANWLGREMRALAVAGPILALLIVWNLGFIFQWGTHMVPARGVISWSTMVHNQFVEVPVRLTHSLETYFTDRGEMMRHIEREDIEQQLPEEKRGE